MEEDFAENRVMVVLSNDASLQFHSYAAADFGEINCAGVQDLSSASGVKIQAKAEAVKTAVMTRSVDVSTLDTSGIDTYNQVLCIQLEDSGKENVLAAIDELMARDDVVYAGPDYAITACSAEDDVAYYDPDENWAIQSMNLQEAWEITTGSADVVGVIDSGIDATHPDLVNNVDVESSYDFITNTAGVSIDPFGHGTRVAGVIGADGYNDFGVTGVCWDVTLVSLRVFNDTGGGNSSTVAAAIQYAQTMQIPILNFSGRWYSHWGNFDYPLQEAIEQYTGLFICSAGNEDINNDTAYVYPANYVLPNLITVGAFDTLYQKWSLSNYGKTTVDIFAPGDLIPTTMAGGEYAQRNATSIAAPHVTGVAALLLSRYPNLTAEQLKIAIMEHARIVVDSEGDSVFGDLCVSGGILDAYAALVHDISRRQTTSHYTHDCYCNDCGFVIESEVHTWVSIPIGFRCTVCGKVSDAALMSSVDSEIAMNYALPVYNID